MKKVEEILERQIAVRRIVIIKIVIIIIHKHCMTDCIYHIIGM